MPEPERVFVEIAVRFSEAEYRKLYRERAFQAEGTVEAAVRTAMGLQEAPLGWKRGTQRHPILSQREYTDREIAEGRHQ